jgi:hypothetical protein
VLALVLVMALGVGIPWSPVRGITEVWAGVVSDDDGDGVPNDQDNCPDVFNPGQADSDTDDIGDACDVCPLDADNDADGDGVCGDVDNCPTVANPDQADLDGDGEGDACDDDRDGDGVLDLADNCPTASNPDQLDSDADDIGDACDACVGDNQFCDTDGDGYTPAEGDCDDADAAINPDASEVPGNGKDDNCNELTDEVLGQSLRVVDDSLPVIVTTRFAGAGFESDIYVFTPGSNGVRFIATNRDFETVDLGTFPAGTELLFGLVVHNTNEGADDTFYMGPACRNFDGFPHAAVALSDAGSNTYAVGLEDLRLTFLGAANYNDAHFTVSNVEAFDAGDCAALGHFMCYGIKATRGNVCSDESDPGFAGRTCQFEEDCGGSSDETDLCVPNKLANLPDPVTLDDPVEDKSFNVKKPAALCNPATKILAATAEAASNAAIHLQSFAIKQATPLPRFVKHTRTVDNQFGTVTLELLKAERLMVPTAKRHGGTEPPFEPDPASHPVDHFKCYKAKAVGTFAPITVGTVDQFGQPKTVTLKKPRRLCLAADKDLEGFKDPEAKLLCYQVVVPKGQPKHVKQTGLFLNNQFGPDQVDTLKETEFCVPSLPPPGDPA